MPAMRSDYYYSVINAESLKVKYSLKYRQIILIVVKVIENVDWLAIKKNWGITVR